MDVMIVSRDSRVTHCRKLLYYLMCIAASGDGWESHHGDLDGRELRHGDLE